MEPVTAFGLAGTILDFTLFAWGLMKGATEIYNSATGSLTENDSLMVVVSDLNRIAEELSQGSNLKTRAELAVESLAGDCKAESERLLALLNKLKLT